MKSAEIERNHELAQVALNIEPRGRQIVNEIRLGNITTALTHIKQAHDIIHRLLCDLERQP